MPGHGELSRFAMYLDQLDGRVDSAFYDRMSAQWRVEQTRLLREIERHGAAEESYMEDGVRLLELARNARQLFARQAPGEKKRLLNLLLSNCSWEDGEVRAVFRQPFDLLAETTAALSTEQSQGIVMSKGHPVWLGFLEAFRTFWVAPQPELRLLMDNVGY